MDDEADIRRVGARVLRHLGYEAEVVADGAEALQAFEKARADGHPFAAAILDLSIVGGMGGLETMSALRQIEPDFKVIISSGYSNEEVQEKLAQGSCAATIGKPYDIAAMGTTLQQVLGARPDQG